jgi:hypothetical protein
MNLARIKSDIQHFAYDCLPVVSRAWGKVLMSKPQTLKRLQPFVVTSEQAEAVFLPHLKSLNGIPFFESGTPESGGQTIRFEPDQVWLLKKGPGITGLKMLPSGNVVLNNRHHLNLDFSPIKGLIESHRAVKEEETLIACWPHGWGAYYDFIIFVLAKWVRIENALGPGIWKESKVAYARLNQPFEQDFAQLLGIEPDRLTDTRSYAGAASVRRAVAANNHSLFYPSPRDLDLIRKRFAPPEGRTGTRKLYISRGKTRRILNEAALHPILERHGIEFIEDIPRTVPEQIALFKDAQLIIGPHGAAFTNMIWAPPGAQVLEFFQKHYYPPYFYYLAKVLGHSYACWIEPPAPGETQHITNRYSDLTVSPEDFERAISQVLTATVRPE